MEKTVSRRLPVGAEVLGDGGGVHFRVCAPAARSVAVALENASVVPLTRESESYFSGTAREARAGDRYRYALDDGEAFPDPVSRFQPEGPHGPSEVIDPTSFRWTDGDWPGVTPEGQVIYEMHVGTFTREGTFTSALRELEPLRDLGVTLLEIMPVADFAGRFGWGYDGVNLFAPSRLYGRPDDFRRFVDEAHRLGLGVILDVVYNHLGPDGCYLRKFAEHYFTDRYKTDWGEPINFDGPDCRPVREFYLGNVRHWIDEYHLDGLRLDATQNIYDAGGCHILAEISRVAREAAGRRKVYLVAENEPQENRLVRPVKDGGHGLDALWNDDFHHSALVALTGSREAYYTDYLGAPQEFIAAAKWGYLYQGQRYSWQKKRRGTPGLDLPPWHFVHFLENHDQVANSLWGRRAHQLTSPGRHRALTALLLLGPQTPMLFQGQEFSATAPFHYFADHQPELAALVRKGRAEFLAQFPSVATPEAQAAIPDPEKVETFERCKLDHAERARHAPAHALHRDLLALRRRDPVLASRGARIDGAVLGESAFVLRWFARDALAREARILVCNLGRELRLTVAPEPLLAPPEGTLWETLWSSEAPRYGGSGTPTLDGDEGWILPAESAVLLRASPVSPTSTP
jgi:maltooligosyltrehalose trehalohydrolase